ncbi:MAG: hypothetical protein HQK54_13650, partial [Oligoflexales bacterium]|nr:hypothetical protein [Oligoflexales bacterium]
GRFNEEARIWLRIYEIDNEDEDAIEYIEKKQMEDRERYYFTDDIPGGGKRFLAYPRSLIRVSLLGLAGCVLFLILTRMTEIYQVGGSSAIISVAFFLLVISPWFGIMYIYSKAIYTVTVDFHGIEVATRFKAYKYKWSELEKICLSNSRDSVSPNLRLILLPANEKEKPISIDMNEDTSAIKARTYLTSEIDMFYGKLSYENYKNLNLDKRKPINF